MVKLTLLYIRLGCCCLSTLFALMAELTSVGRKKMFWTIPSVLQAQSPVKIHVLGPSKLLPGLTETGHSLLKTRYRELVAAIGAVFQDLKIGQFFDRDIISKPTVPSTWKKELVGTVYVLDVAPWWYLSRLLLPRYYAGTSRTVSGGVLGRCARPHGV